MGRSRTGSGLGTCRELGASRLDRETRAGRAASDDQVRALGLGAGPPLGEGCRTWPVYAPRHGAADPARTATGARHQRALLHGLRQRGSSIYYALALVASYALGLTPIVFLLPGVIFYLSAA